MYVTQLEDTKLTLGVSGMLWQRSLVMYDQETETLWSHLLGRAMQGKLKGTELEQVPSVMTTWAGFRQAHSNATAVIMSRTDENYTDKIYRNPRRFVFGIATGDKALAWSFETLRKQPLIHGEWRESPFVVLYDHAAVTPRMYSARIEGQQLTFAVDKTGVVVDQQTNSAWNPVSGQATRGPLQGKFLPALPGIVSLKRAWQAFHPESEIN